MARKRTGTAVAHDEMVVGDVTAHIEAHADFDNAKYVATVYFTGEFLPEQVLWRNGATDEYGEQRPNKEQKYAITMDNEREVIVDGRKFILRESESKFMKRFQKKVRQNLWFLHCISEREKPFANNSKSKGADCMLLMTALPSSAWTEIDYRTTNRRNPSLVFND